ncbi:hypothetical protein [Mesoterricola silvestris]|uniref:hypothetical protein n=1 Tax=Mesoterricola silvestris TaxID=2927979 RepID=UPI00292EDFD6|nr:hypothetical protein [Mesoterricola silvestris]
MGATLARDSVALLIHAPGEVVVFFAGFNMATLASMVPSDYIMTKLLATKGSHIRVSVLDLVFNVLFSATFALAMGFQAEGRIWALVAAGNLLLAYPTGVFYARKQYFFARAFAGGVSAISAALFLLHFRLDRMYACAVVSLVILGWTIVLIAGGIRFEWRKSIDFKTLLRFTVSSTPFALFYGGNFHLLKASEGMGRLPLLGNRSCYYVYAVMMMAAPVVLKAVSEKPEWFLGFIHRQRRRALVLLVSTAALPAILVAFGSLRLQLIGANVILLVSAILLYFLYKLIIIRDEVALLARSTLAVSVVLYILFLVPLALHLGLRIFATALVAIELIGLFHLLGLAKPKTKMGM